MAELPTVMVTGPRAAGKTTSARRLAADVLRLDEPAVAASVRADPDAALRRATEPVLLDEWQEVPEVLGAVKRAVDDDPRPGRFLLTGSVEADLTHRMWPGTGRVVRVVLHGLTERELIGSRSDLIALAKTGDLANLRMPNDVPDIDGYVTRALRGSSPEPALRLGREGRQAWMDAYVEHVEHVVSRDVRAAGQVRDPVRLRRYLEVLGLSTAGLPADTTLSQAAGIDGRTADAYDGLLESLYLLDRVPVWSSNRVARLAKRPKCYLVDPALAMSAARIDQDDVLRDGDLLGRVLDTFVAAQLRPEVDLLPRARMHHLRTDGGRQEVDLVVDLGGGRVIGFEVKAGAAPGPRDARHLAWMRDQLGDRFVRGVVLHTGPRPFELGDRLWALPIWALWAPESDPDHRDRDVAMGEQVPQVVVVTGSIWSPGTATSEQGVDDVAGGGPGDQLAGSAGFGEAGGADVDHADLPGLAGGTPPGPGDDRRRRHEGGAGPATELYEPGDPAVVPVDGDQRAGVENEVHAADSPVPPGAR